jgi:hypothetical protein
MCGLGWASHLVCLNPIARNWSETLPILSKTVKGQFTAWLTIFLMLKITDPTQTTNWGTTKHTNHTKKRRKSESSASSPFRVVCVFRGFPACLRVVRGCYPIF